MSNDDETPQAVEQPVHEIPGALLNREAARARNRSVSGPSQSDTLRIAAPAYHRIWLAWLMAGPLNPTILIWVVFFMIDGEFSPWTVFWFVSFPSAIAALLGTELARGRSAYSSKYLILLSLKMWLLVSVFFIVLASPLAFSTAPGLLILFLGIAIVFGLPAALAGAIVARLIVFRRKQPAPTAPLSTP
jgi:hypothetical protein|tara:strand:+ start:106455 stop:107021 length:567 start_codon:yes stop_codon:yes gene_type:complete